MPDCTPPIAPIKRHVERMLIHRAQAEMNIRTAFARMPVAPIHFFHQLSAVGKVNSDSSSDGRASPSTDPRVTIADGCGARSHWQKNVQPKKCPLGFTKVAKDEGIPPLICRHKIQAAVSIHIADRDTTSQPRIS